MDNLPVIVENRRSLELPLEVLWPLLSVEVCIARPLRTNLVRAIRVLLIAIVVQEKFVISVRIQMLKRKGFRAVHFYQAFTVETGYMFDLHHFCPEHCASLPSDSL
jgi:hypothetical protein